MTVRWIFAIVVILSLWTGCLSDRHCNSSIVDGSSIVFTCSSVADFEELPLYQYTTDQLKDIVSIVVRGPDDSTAGPFTSIPPNICLLPNLKVSQACVLDCLFRSESTFRALISLVIVLVKSIRQER